MSTLSASRGTVQDAAEYFGVSTRTVRRWLNSGRISGYRVGPTLIRVDLDSLDSAVRPYGGAR